MAKDAFLSARASPRQNKLLAALPATDYDRLLPHLQLAPMPLGMVVPEADDDGRGYAFFPVTGIACKLYFTAEGCSTQVAVVGNEGVVGIALLMGGESTSSRAVVFSAGHGYRLGASVLKTEFSRGAHLHELLLRYTQARMTQVLQTAVCNRHHSVEQQLCRLLLLTLDRLPRSELTLSHELIADMLGVRRESVTEAAGRLRAAGLIEYSRGHITVFERSRLEAQVCECYAVVKKEYDRLLPKVASPSARLPAPASFSPGRRSLNMPEQRWLRKRPIARPRAADAAHPRGLR